MEDQKTTEDIILCADCDAELSGVDDARNADNERICESCREDYFVCDNCNDVFHSDDCHGENGCYCESCYDDLFCHCESCNDEMSQNNANEVNGDYYCNDCYNDRYSCCDNCGDIYSIDDLHYHERRERDFCDNCYPNNDAINDYRYKPPANFLKVDTEKNIKDFYGIELEVECSDREGIAEHLKDHFSNDEDFFYIKSDGSLNDGIEIVSHPMTLKYHQQFAWENVLKYLSSNRCKSFNTDTCGIHIHVSKKALSESEKIKLGIFVNTQQNRVEKIAQRKQSSWAKYKNKTYKNMAYSDERYEALNWTNNNTVEFRIFKGTLAYASFMAYLEFTHSCIQFVKSVSTMQLIDIDKAWKLYLEYITANKKEYKYLDEYLTKKGVK